MDYRAGFTGDYISAPELEGKTPTLSMREIKLEDVAEIKNGVETGKTKKKWVIYLGKLDRGWILNRTNAEALKEMFGCDVDAWVNKRVTLHTQMVQVGPRKELGIRVKGSPDIQQDVTFMLTLPKKKPIPYKLEKTLPRQAETQGEPT